MSGVPCEGSPLIGFSRVSLSWNSPGPGSVISGASTSYQPSCVKVPIVYVS